MAIFPTTTTVHDSGQFQRLCCNVCGKTVSTSFLAVPTDTPDKGLIVRAWIECPECMEKKDK